MRRRVRHTFSAGGIVLRTTMFGQDIVLVRRLAQGLWALPKGTPIGEETPAETARREVEEETGLSVTELVLLVETYADVGRLSNRLFGFFALVDGAVSSTEVGLEAMLVPGGRIRAMAAGGEIAIAANVGLLYLASYHPRVRAICSELGFHHPPWVDE